MFIFIALFIHKGISICFTYGILKNGVGKTISQYNAVQFNTTANYNHNNWQIIKSKPLRQYQSELNIIIFEKVEFMAVRLY